MSRPARLFFKPYHNLFIRNPNKAKKCKCYLCNEYGYYVDECPKRFNQKKIELNNEIEKTCTFNKMEVVFKEEGLHLQLPF